jgi:ATP-dependent RNA helicase DHX29
VVWSKDQDTEYEKDVDGVLCTLRTLRITFTAATIAAVSVEQSEGFISTVALFSLFVSSPKEEKLYLRLPTNWRELYREYLEQRKTRIDAEDRETIQRLRSLIQEQLDTEESEGIVLINRFKLRNQATSNSSTSNSGRLTPLPVNEGLRNFWWQKASTPAYQLMLLKRANLPVFGFRASILSTIDQNQVTIICGETGCGKSTQIPSYILEHEISQGNACKVYCTEPRRISAISLAQRVSEELGEAPNDLGTPRSVVGYAIRLETKTSSQTRLIFATVGVVLRMLESSRGLDEVTHLIIDEVHERR